MKKYLIVTLVIISVLFGNYYTVNNCESEDCCMTECCEENAASDFSKMDLTFSDKDCCEYNQGFENETQQAVSITASSKTHIVTLLTSLQNHITDEDDSNYNLKKSFAPHFRQHHSISILRI